MSTTSNFALFFLGVVVWALTPSVLMRTLSDERQHIAHRVVQAYLGNAFEAFERGLLVDLTHTGYRLVRSKYNPDWGLEEVDVHGKTQYFSDKAHLMLRAYRADMGMVIEDIIGIFTPKYADIAEAEYNKASEDKLFKKDRKKEKKKRGSKEVIETTEEKTVPNTTLDIPKKMRLVDFSYLPIIMRRHMEPQDPGIIGDMVKESQSKFESVSVWDVMILLTMFIVGGGLVWFVGGEGGGAGVSAPTIDMPIMIDALAVML